MEAGSAEVSVASSLERAGEVVDAVSLNLASRYYNFVVDVGQARWPTFCGVRDMRGVQR